MASRPLRTLAQSWADRLADLRATCRRKGQRLGADLRRECEREHAREWRDKFCKAVVRGEDLSPAAWRSAWKLLLGDSPRKILDK